MKLKKYAYYRGSEGLQRYAFMILLMTLAVAGAGNAIAAMKMTKTVDGFEATLSISPKMADLRLVEAGSGRAVMNAVVTATVVSPSGQKRVKKLMGMKMGEVYSYMNSIDMSSKGRYTFHITVKAGERIVSLEFENVDI